MPERPRLEAVVFDAGGTLVRLDFEWMAGAVTTLGHALDAATLRRAEVEGRRRYDATVGALTDGVAGTLPLGRAGDTRSYFSGMLRAAGVPDAVIDPVLQMKRNVAALRAQSGRAGPDDFVPMVARLAQALGPKGLDAIAALEYRDGTVKVRFNPAVATGSSARDSLRQACARLGMRLAFDNERDLTATLSVQGT